MHVVVENDFSCLKITILLFRKFTGFIPIGV